MLPDSILTNILALLSPQELVHIHFVSRKFHQLILQYSNQLRKFDDLPVRIILGGSHRHYVDFNFPGTSRNANQLTKTFEVSQSVLIGNYEIEWRKSKADGPRKAVMFGPLPEAVGDKRKHFALFLDELFSFLFRFIHVKSIRTNLQEGLLEEIIARLPLSLDEITQDLREQEEKANKPQIGNRGHGGLLRVLTERPMISSLTLDDPLAPSTKFFAHPAVQRLRIVQILAPCGNLNDELFTQQQWLQAELSKTNVTSKGLNEALQQWANGQREIEAWTLGFQSENPIRLEEVLSDIPVATTDMGFATMLSRPDGRFLQLSVKSEFSRYRRLQKNVVITGA